ncbi:MAG: class I SAM-dependent methyltransferase [Oscillospiraceae bacterium]|nr:class I SAM-dependent methyltransferase [Oscillospiraceae bacterium]
MEKYTEQNKLAWEYDAYNFWVNHFGIPSEKAKMDLEDPRKMLKKYSKFFQNVESIRIANICGSCGNKAIPLAILGADVSIFDISEQNKRYACETADAAGVHINFVVGDVLNIDMSTYGQYFDIAFMEGGILHYFHDIDKFMSVIYNILKPDSKLILSDFHPFNRIANALGIGINTEGADYFSTEVTEGEMAHAPFYDDEKRKQFPKCICRTYTLSEIINSVINAGFIIKRFEEYPGWVNQKLPGEFTILAHKKLNINNND